MTEHTVLRQAIEPLIADYLATGVPAAAIEVRRDNQVLLRHAWGRIDEASAPCTLDTRFDLASLTKLFTTTALLTLVARGRVALDDPLVAHVPDFGGPARGYDGGVDPHSKQPLPMNDALTGQAQDPQRVTLRHLLTHSSGLAAWRPVYAAAGPPPVPPDQVDPVPRAERWRRGLAFVVSAPFVDPIGARVRYSDLGFMLLGEVVARLHGGDLKQAIAELVLRPAGLTTITYSPMQHGVPRALIAPTEDDPAWRGRRIWGEVHDENACGLGGVAGHAGLFGALQDVAQFGETWRSAPQVWGMSTDLRAEATSPHIIYEGEARGLGWLIRTPELLSTGRHMPDGAHGHTGFTGTSLWIDPFHRLTVVILTNSVYVGRHIFDPRPLRQAVHEAIYEALGLAAS
ncbi:MAG: beta-lactamase family protein [Anaerolineae bacterium]|nr:beta-lactamase family protein [Anaerolineae bacterium]MDW8173517.1 serine hydrolase domain-containing protein [Anaerolineae bacterium]